VSESLEQEIRTLRSLYWSERDPEGRAFAPLADAYLRAGETKEALDLLTDGTTRHPGFSSGHVVAARLFLQQGMLSEAELSARRVLELDAENVVALESLAQVLQATGASEEAARLAATLAELDPEAAPPAVVDSPAVVADAQDDVSFEITPATREEPEPEEAAPGGEHGAVLELTADFAGPEAALEAELGTIVPADLGEEPPGLPDMDLDAVASDQPAPTDFAAVAPGAEVEPAADADMEPEPVSLDALAPDVVEPEPVSLDDLAPDEPEPEGEVMSVDALAPDGAEPEPVSLDALAPDAEEPEPIGLAALAPDAAEPEAVDSAAPAYDPARPPAPRESASTPIHTRTLAELYVKQGFVDKALDVLRHILRENPDARDVRERIAQLERGELGGPTRAPEPGPQALGGPALAPDQEEAASEEGSPVAEAYGSARREDAEPTAGAGPGPDTAPGLLSLEGLSFDVDETDEVETLARELADGGPGEHDVDTPFAWTEGDPDEPEDGSDEGPRIGDYFDALLGWEPRDKS